jgi:hypothetical protein
MNMKKSSLAAAVTALLAIGASQQAIADIYAGASLDIANLQITIPENTGTGVTGYTFTVNNFAQLNNGAPAANGAICGGDLTTTPPSTTCNANPLLGPVLSAPAANALGSTLTRTDNTYVFLGPTVGQTFSNADAQITTAQVVQGVPTSASQIAEAELAHTGNAQANTSINSQTRFMFAFTVTDPVTGTTGTVPGTFRLSFDADPDQFVYLNTPGVRGTPFAQATVGATFRLTGTDSTTGDVITDVVWNPDGSLLTGPTTCTGVTCLQIADTQNLNSTLPLAPPTNPSARGYSDARFGIDPGLTHFELFITGLTAGDYTLALTGTTNVNISQTVPEPGILGLMGIGLLGLIGAGRRKKVA